MSGLTVTHTVFDNVDEMIARQTLGELLAKPVARVNLCPMDGHAGLAGGRLDYVDTDAGRLVLKRMSIAYDWIMVVTDDYKGRSVRLWEYGLLDQLTPNIEHTIVACSRDGDGWAILMSDLGDGCCNPSDLPREYAPVFLDALAKIHATFWNDPRLEDPRLGLADSAAVFNFFHRAKNYTGSSYGVIPEWVRVGWDIMADLLDNEVFADMVAIHDDPEPLVRALNRYPYTLRHGDFRAENLALTERPAVIDWQQASRSLMTIDLAWYTRQLHFSHVASPADAIDYYRKRLELHLGRRLDDEHWKTMVELGFAVDALFASCFDAYFSVFDPVPGMRALHESLVLDRTQLLVDSLCRL